jgi:hypothetical protein
MLITTFTFNAETEKGSTFILLLNAEKMTLSLKLRQHGMVSSNDCKI